VIPVVLHTFIPKEIASPFYTGHRWQVQLERVGSESGFDYNLLVTELGTDVEYLIEAGISREGKLILQVTDQGSGVVILND
jgi:hypothetical protein